MISVKNKNIIIGIIIILLISIICLFIMYYIMNDTQNSIIFLAILCISTFLYYLIQFIKLENKRKLIKKYFNILIENKINKNNNSILLQLLFGFLFLIFGLAFIGSLSQIFLVLLVSIIIFLLFIIIVIYGFNNNTKNIAILIGSIFSTIIVTILTVFYFNIMILSNNQIEKNNNVIQEYIYSNWIFNKNMFYEKGEGINFIDTIDNKEYIFTENEENIKIKKILLNIGIYNKKNTFLGKLDFNYNKYINNNKCIMLSQNTINKFLSNYIRNKNIIYKYNYYYLQSYNDFKLQSPNYDNKYIQSGYITFNNYKEKEYQFIVTLFISYLLVLIGCMQLYYIIFNSIIKDNDSINDDTVKNDKSYKGKLHKMNKIHSKYKKDIQELISIIEIKNKYIKKLEKNHIKKIL